MSLTMKDKLLMIVLKCGSADLELLENIKYDWDCIFEHEMEDVELDFNRIMYAVFCYGLGEIEKRVDDRICELEAIPNERELDEDEEKEMKLLRELRPYDDFSSFYDHLNTHVYCNAHSGTYKKYMNEALDEFERNTGFDIFINGGEVQI